MSREVTAITGVAGSESVAGSRKGRWRSLGAMAVASVSDNTENGLVNTLFPVIRQAFGVGLDALGLLTSISRFARMLFGPLWSMAADRFGRKRVLFIVTGLWGLWTAAAGFAQDFNQLLILYTIGVIGTVASEPISNGLLADLFEEEERGKAFGAIRSIGSAGGVILTPLIGQLARVEDGWRYGMFLMGALSLVSGILILLFVREPKKRTPSEGDEIKEFRLRDVITLFKTPSFLIMAGTIPLLTSLVLSAFFVTYYVDVRGWETADATILYTIFIAGFTVSSFLGGLLGDCFDKRFGPNGRVMLMQAYLVAYSVMSFLVMQIDWGHAGMLYVLLFLFGLTASIGFSGCVLPMVSAIVPREITATAFALLFSFIQGLLAAVLSLAMGYLAKTYGLQNVMLWMVTVPYLANAAYWFLFYRVYPRDVARQKAMIESP
jgi:MFS family permease